MSSADSTGGREARPEGSARSPRAVTTLVVGVLFYTSMAAVALIWRVAIYREPIFFTSAESAREGLQLGRDVGVGILAGAGVVLVSWGITRMTLWGARLAGALAQALGPLALHQALLLALASGIAEEMLFRGALQPRVGLIAASLLFGLVHFVPRRELVPWTGFAILAGFLFGALFVWTGNLVAPILAHVIVNGVNLPLLVADAQKRIPTTDESPDAPPDDWGFEGDR